MGICVCVVHMLICGLCVIIFLCRLPLRTIDPPIWQSDESTGKSGNPAKSETHAKNPIKIRFLSLVHRAHPIRIRDQPVFFIVHRRFVIRMTIRGVEIIHSRCKKITYPAVDLESFSLFGGRLRGK